MELEKWRNGRRRSKGAVVLRLTLAKPIFLVQKRTVSIVTLVIFVAVISAIVVHVHLGLGCTSARQTRGRKVSSDCGWLPGCRERLGTHALKIGIGMVLVVLVYPKAPRAWVLIVTCRWFVVMVIGVVVTDNIFRAVKGPSNGMSSFDGASAEDRLKMSATLLK